MPPTTTPTTRAPPHVQTATTTTIPATTTPTTRVRPRVRTATTTTPVTTTALRTSPATTAPVTPATATRTTTNLGSCPLPQAQRRSVEPRPRLASEPSSASTDAWSTASRG